MSTTEESTAVPNDETPEDRDQGEQSRRLSTDRDDSPAPDPAEAAPEDAEDTPEDAEDTPDAEDAEDAADGDTFPRAYVQRLRDRSAGYRTRAKDAEDRADTLARALFTERVRALDVLTDPTDLPFDADMLEDPDALADAARALVRERPHYGRRGTVSRADTGSRDTAEHGGVSLFGIMRRGT